MCFYVHERWCTDTKVLRRSCTPELEALSVRCRPFYLPREFASIILVAVYIHPLAGGTEAARQLAIHITELENAYPHSAVLIMGDVNHVNLRKSLPWYKQQIHAATRGEKTLDQCYSKISQAFHAVVRAPLGRSDHNSILLIPQYRQQLKTCKRSCKTVRQWSPQAVDSLSDCLEQTDWSVFRDACVDLDEYTDTVTSYINFAENVCIPSKNVIVFSNNKPWFSKEVKALCSKKNEAFKSGNKEAFKVARYEFERAMKKAKAKYNENLQAKLRANDTKGVWQGMQTITGYKGSRRTPADDPLLPDRLNEFYCRFDMPIDVKHSPAVAGLEPTTAPPFVISEQEVTTRDVTVNRIYRIPR